jgi:lipopolysaccharide transport system ATP-binding protein
MHTQASILLQDIHVDGINTKLRAEGVKQLVLSGRTMGKNLRIPILRGVSLSVKPGERVGIVGHNGSGKSSLLKVIAGIYPPKLGDVHIQGRIAPLIEMSVGFDGELSGRENIMLGLVYSGRLQEYSKELEERIIAFTELGDAIDRPLKGFSSGMKARLSFAVSVFQQPDILLLDEAFATGDPLFVEKSRQVMEAKFASVPIAVLVTHDPALVYKFCDRCVWMDHGHVKDDGTPERVLKYYEHSIEQAVR